MRSTGSQSSNQFASKRGRCNITTTCEVSSNVSSIYCNLPTNNLFGDPVGTTQMVADGFYVFLQPLSSGKHEIQFSGITPGDPTTGTAIFAINTLYHITVQ